MENHLETHSRFCATESFVHLCSQTFSFSQFFRIKAETFGYLRVIKRAARRSLPASVRSGLVTNSCSLHSDNIRVGGCLLGSHMSSRTVLSLSVSTDRTPPSAACRVRPARWTEPVRAERETAWVTEVNMFRCVSWLHSTLFLLSELLPFLFLCECRNMPTR